MKDQIGDIVDGNLLNRQEYLKLSHNFDELYALYQAGFLAVTYKGVL